MKKHSFVATLFRLVTTLFQHFTLCWAKNRPYESSRVTSPLNTLKFRK